MLIFSSNKAPAMPGHILHAECVCGFRRELSPGSSIVGDRCVGYTIAYSSDDSDLLTEGDEVVQSKQLRALPNPFLSTFEPGDSMAKLEYEEFEKKKAPQGPCGPSCQTNRLVLHFRGWWD